MSGPGCSVETCALPLYARGLCNPHYQRLRQTGDVRSGVPIGFRPSLDERRERRGRWNVENREALQAARARWARKHPGNAAKRSKAWRKRHPERRRVQKLRRDALERGAPYTEAGLAYAALLRRDPCAYCGGPAGEVDHLTPLVRGGDSDWPNLAAACRRCNAQKRDRAVLLFLAVRDEALMASPIYGEAA